MTAVVFVIALVVAALGIPGVLSWLQQRLPQRRKAIDVPLDEYIASLPRVKDPRVLVPPSSPSGVVRPPGPSPIPQLSAQGAADNLIRVLGNQSSSALWANVNAARAAAAAATGDPPPPPGPAPSCSGCGRPGPVCQADPCWGRGRNGGGGRGGDVGSPYVDPPRSGRRRD